MNNRDFQTMLLQLRAADCKVKSYRKGSKLRYKVYNANGFLILSARRLKHYYAIDSVAGSY